MGDSYESVYSGGISSMDPYFGKENLVGYNKITSGQLSSTTGIGTSNQLGEVVARIKEGVKNVELQPVSNPDLIDQIPMQHWKEMHALMKLSGVKASVHAPIIDPVGFGKRGWEGEQARLEAERRFKNVIEKAHMLDPDGNTPVVFHSANDGYGPSYTPGDVDKGEERFKKVEDVAINVDTGEMAPLKEKRRFSPYDLNSLKEEVNQSGRIRNTTEELDNINRTVWEKSIKDTAISQKYVDEMAGEALSIMESFKKLPQEEFQRRMKNDEKERTDFENSQAKLDRASVFLEDIELSARTSFEKLYEYGTDKQRNELKKLAEELDLKKFASAGGSSPLLFKEKLHAYTTFAERINFLSSGRNPDTQKEDDNFSAPKMFKPIEEFSLEKTAKTFGNVAWHGYDKFGDNAPIVAMENMYQGMQFSRAEDMTKLVEETKKVFVKNAMKTGMDESQAKKKADKVIGVTWDVGHLNMMKKRGFTDKDVISESEKISPLVKHVHLTDNFGQGDSHLAPGMGNVPFKEILEKLEKNGDFKGMKKVIEAGALVMQGGLGMSPLVATLKAFGSPIYGMQNSTYWNQASGMMGGYFSGYGDSNPSGHHSIYGSGFTTLPRDFGGNVPGTNSRFSGTPNA
jgi:sugar phosphate isomerase/epimerase